MNGQTEITMNTKPTKTISGTSRIPTSGRDSGTHSRSSSISNLTTASDVRSDDVSEASFDFKINDQVWVNGTKPGILKFLGKTSFATGIWAGILLNESIGKNDGSVNGIKYFECEPQRGIFARPQKLTKVPSLSPIGDSSSVVGSTSKVTKSLTPPNRNSSTPSASTPKVCSRLRLGEKVVVNSTVGVKTGILRFLGETEFAKGEWAGIELDEPLGKNDGSVAGKRYFECKMKHGLFAPIHKVSHAGGTSISRPSSVRGVPLTSRMRSNSKESLSSSISNISRTSRVKLGVTSLTSSQKSPNESSFSLANYRALEEVLKEKEQHIEQLLKERDLERADVARAASKYEEDRQKFSDFDAKYAQLSERFDKTDLKYKNVENQLAENQRKLEDLQFQLEEELIAKGELKIELQQKNVVLKRLEDFASKVMGGKFKIFQEILKGQEYLSAGDEQEELSEMEKLQEKILKLESELQTALNNKTKALETVQELENLNKSLQITENKLSEKENEVISLQKTLVGTNEKISILTKEIEVMSKQLIEKNEQDKIQTNDLAILKENLSKKDQIIMELENKIHTVEDKLNADKNEKLSSLQNQLLELETEKDRIKCELEKKFDSSSTQLKNTVDELNSTKTLLSEKEQQIFSLTNNLNDKEFSFNEAKSQLEELTQKCAILKDENQLKETTFASELQKAKEELESIQKSKEEVVLNLSKEVEQLNKSLLEMSSSLSLKENELQNLLINSQEHSVKFAELNSQLKSSEDKLLSMTNESSKKINDLQKELVQVKEESETMKLNLEKKIKELINESENASALLKAKNDSDLEKSAHILLLDQDIKEKDQQLLNISEKLTSLSEDYKKLAEEKENNEKLYNKNLDNIKKENKKLIESKEMELEALSIKCQDLIKSLEKEELHSLEKETQFNDLTKDLEGKQGEIAQLTSKLTLAEQKLEMLNENSTEQVKSLQIEMSKIKEESDNKIFTLEKEIMNLNKQHDENITSLKEKEDQIKQKDMLITSLQKQLEDNKTQTLELSSKITKLNEKLSFLTQEKTNSQTVFENQISSLKSENEVQLLKKDQLIEETKTQLSHSAQLLQSKDQELIKKDNDILVLKNIIDEKEAQFDQLSTMIESSRNQLFQLKLQNENNLELLKSKESFINEFKAEQEKQLELKEEKFQNEIKKIEAILSEKETALKMREENILKLTTEKENLAKQLDVLDFELKKIKEGKEDDIKNFENNSKSLNDKVVELEARCKKLKEEKDIISNKELATQNAKKELEIMRDDLLQEKMAQEKIVKDRESKLEALQAEVDRMQEEFALHKQELQQKLDVSHIEVQAGLELKNQLEVQHSVLEELQEDLQKSEDVRKNLQSQLENLSLIELQKNDLEKKLIEFEKINKGKDEKIKSIEEKCHSLEELLNNNQNLLKEKEKELLNLNDKLGPLQKDAHSNEKLSSLLKHFEEENINLKNKIKELEILSEKTPKIEGADSYPSTDEEKESLHSQIDFLNSIIVDMKQKNEELTQRLDLQAHLWDESDLNLNGIKKPMELPPRLFCDICDMFDLHDTEDCPKQVSQLEDEPPPKLKNTNKMEERPYCNNCEMFGHWTLDCDEQETF